MFKKFWGFVKRIAENVIAGLIVVSIVALV